MAATPIFIGNISDKVMTYGDFDMVIYPGNYANVSIRSSVADILRSEEITRDHAAGLIEIRAGGTTWSDANLCASLPDVVHHLSADEKAILGTP